MTADSDILCSKNIFSIFILTSFLFPLHFHLFLFFSRTVGRRSLLALLFLINAFMCESAFLCSAWRQDEGSTRDDGTHSKQPCTCVRIARPPISPLCVLVLINRYTYKENVCPSLKDIFNLSFTRGNKRFFGDPLGVLTFQKKKEVR